MEVGAVKQAFNNEVIQMKRNLNQAKIHVIHKLTRKAKKEVKKEAPEKLKEKFKRQAASAVNEVLIIKKIKPRDIARFTVTHTGELQQHLNKPAVDQDKACARLLLHKSLQAKYKHIRNTFSGIPIKDLLMSRQERLKLKREAKLDKKFKKDKRRKTVNAEGEWDVEDINPRKVNDFPKSTSKTFKKSDDDISGSDQDMEFDKNVNSDEAQSDNEEISHDENNGSDDDEKPDDSDDQNDEDDDSDVQSDRSEAESETKMEDDQESEDSEKKIEPKKEDKLRKLVKPSSAVVNIKPNENTRPALTFEQLGKNRRKPEIKNASKPKDSHKNKNLKDKLQTRKFKKESSESHVKETKIVDPFFITSTGENYMSVAEPRQPDEVKEIHKQGNRKERRAAMFGHAPKVKPRQDFRQNNSNRSNDSTGGFRDKFNQSGEGRYNNKGNEFRNRNDSKYNGKDNQFRNQNDKPFGGRNNNIKDQFMGKNGSKFKGRNNDAVEAKVEKLHPSWEAKKKQSGILPFQGKKIVFDEG